jgi:hypothetical protein
MLEEREQTLTTLQDLVCFKLDKVLNTSTSFSSAKLACQNVADLHVIEVEIVVAKFSSHILSYTIVLGYRMI